MLWSVGKITSRLLAPEIWIITELPGCQKNSGTFSENLDNHPTARTTTTTHHGYTTHKRRNGNSRAESTRVANMQATVVALRTMLCTVTDIQHKTSLFPFWQTAHPWWKLAIELIVHLFSSGSRLFSKMIYSIYCSWQPSHVWASHIKAMFQNQPPTTI